MCKVDDTSETHKKKMQSFDEKKEMRNVYIP